MGWGSIDAANEQLAAQYGASKVYGAANLEFSLWDDDPRTTGVELTDALTVPRATAANDGTTWPNPPSGGAITSAPITFGPSAGEMDPASWWAIHDAADDTILDVSRLDRAIDSIVGAGHTVRVRFTVSNPTSNPLGA